MLSGGLAVTVVAHAVFCYFSSLFVSAVCLCVARELVLTKHAEEKDRPFLLFLQVSQEQNASAMGTPPHEGIPPLDTKAILDQHHRTLCDTQHHFYGGP